MNKRLDVSYLSDMRCRISQVKMRKGTVYEKESLGNDCGDFNNDNFN